MVTEVATGAIARPGLSGRIDAALAVGSVLVIADAGFGKTTALRQALEGSHTNAAWIRSGDAGGDPGRLLGLIVEAVGRALPGAADALAERLAAAREPVDPERAAEALERELASVLVDRLVIVLDDGETLDASPRAMGVVGRLLASESSLLRVALASRRRPPLRLGRHRAMGRVAEIGPADLAFSATECARYLRLREGREPDEAEVEAVLVATEGWPLGVALAATVGEESRRVPSRDVVHDYFKEEVLDALEPAGRRAVLAASTAPDLGIAEAAGFWPQGDLAAAIDRRGLFVRDDGAGEGPHFHPLFREVLRSCFANETRAEEQRAVATKIGDALTTAGRGAEAVDYYIKAKDWSTAVDAITREGPVLVRRAAESVAAWLAALPADYAAQPELTLLAGQLAHGQGRFADAVQRCRIAVEGLDAANAAPAQRFAARFALGDALMAIGDLDGAAGLADVLDDPPAVGDVAARAVGVFAAAALARQGSFAEGLALLERALDDPCAAAMDGLAPTFHAYYLDLPAGRLDDALAHARQAVGVLETADPTGRLPYVLTWLMGIHDERGEDAEALAVAARARAQAREAGLAGWVGEAISIRIASLRARAGDVGGAEAHLGEVSAGWRAWGAWELEATRATIAARSGEGREAQAAAERATREVQDWPYFDRARCAALVAPVLAASGAPGRAREIVEATIAARPGGFSTARLQAVLAWLLHDEGHQAASAGALASAWAQAGDQARYLVRREWPRIERPLWEALAEGAITADAGIGALAVGAPARASLEDFARHPVAAVRRAVLLGALAAGRPEGVEQAPEFLGDIDPGVRAAAQAVVDRTRRNPPPLTFRLLGGFELRRATWPIADSAWERRVAQRLVRFLLCHDCGPVLEDDLIAAFWPDTNASAARRSLQVAVSAARAVLDPPGATDTRLVCSQRTYRLCLRQGDLVDAYEFEHAAATALATTAGGRRAALQAAATLWGGEPMPEERYADWATAWRERLIDRRAEVLAALADACTSAADYAAAVDVSRQLVELDPLDEAAQRRLICAFARAGRRGHALRQFLACRHALVTSLGVEPSEETAALQRRVLAGEFV